LPLPRHAHESRPHGATAPGRLPVRPLRAARRLATLLLAAAALAIAGGCATPPLDRYLLQSEGDVRIRGANGLLSSEQSKAILDGLTSKANDGDVLKRHIAVEEALAGNPLSTGNKVVLLEDGTKTYADMLAAIRGARQSLHMETYIFDDDDVGRQFAAVLLERAKAGVKVKLLYDAVGSMKTPPEFFKALENGGIAVEKFNPLGPTGLLKGPVELNHRDHRKLTIVDGHIAYLGGINISAVYSRGRSGSGPATERDPPFQERAWRDTQVRIEGPVVADLQRAFLKQWARVRNEAVPEGKQYFPALAARGPTIVRAIEGAPSEDGINVLYVALISAIEHAEKEVHITNAYFVPSRELLAALEGAARRGVDVRLILPSRTDSWLTFHAGRSFYEDLLEAGVKIFERKNRLLHAKTATIDGVWSTVGSTNLDWRSLADNDELNAVILGPDFAGQLEAMFRKDIADSTEITREAWRRRAIKDRVREAAAVAWARLL
jgi:cardiolipin synthase